MRKSADIKINDKLKDIKIGLTLTSKRPFANIIKEKNTSKIFNNRNANCHSYPKITLHSAIKNTGSENKNNGGL